MIFLQNDYSLGAHPKVLQALVDTNLENTLPYGEDEYCTAAADRIRDMIGRPDAAVHFLTGGTQTNQTALAAFLQRPHYSVISADTGHICVHETGAIEATGHKINHVATEDGKLTPEGIEHVMFLHEDEHWVSPKGIYISNSTETGLIYSRRELLDLRACCNKHGLFMYLDGARLAMALTSEKNLTASASDEECGAADGPVDFKFLGWICDAFYIGGTKCGALFGEALVILNDALKSEMRPLIKQRGGMIAKGRLLGVQFDTLLADNLYLDLGANANRMARLLADGIRAKAAADPSKGYEFIAPFETNMIFILVPKEMVPQLAEKAAFETYPVMTDTHQGIRLVTSWATTEEEVNAFLDLL